MAEKIYNWTDDPMVSGVADCNTDVVNDCLMHLKYENTSDAIQNMYETGQVEKQSRAFNQLLSMKRSIFDKSKFTVVGNPTITDDGVASGFSNSNYLKCSGILSTTEKHNYVLKSAYTHLKDNFTISRYILDVITTSGAYNGVLVRSSKKFAVVLNSTIVETQITPEIGKSYAIELRTDFQTYAKLYVDGILSASVTARTTGLPDSGNVLVGIDTQATMPLVTGAIDLKSVSVVSDGKEVFSGNKTVIDVIKPDNYEIVGSPVISNDGVASGFDKESYIKTSTIDFSKPFIIHSSFTLDNNAKTAPADNYIFSTSSNRYFALAVMPSLKIKARLGNGSSWTEYATTYICEVGKKYYIKLVYDGTIFYLYISADDINFSLILTKQLDIIYPTNETIAIGIFSVSQGGEMYGSIDLNAFKIYVYGDLVYQPCLKIPYTQSKTGSKIVDGNYRDRVQDVYEQFGTASYYTLDETNQNFTLPMGEIYGMIEQKADVTWVRDIGFALIDKADKSTVETAIANLNAKTARYVKERFLSDDGLSWYTLWSDNWLEQGGVLTGGGDYNRTVTFLKEFANANYTILKNSGGGGSGGVAERWMGFWGLTTTSAVTGYINHSERWYACGYAKGEN